MNFKQGGFSLIQLLFVVAVVSGLLYIVIGQQKVLKDMKVTANFNGEVNELSRHIGEVLADPFICSASVANITIGQISGPAPAPGRPKIGQESGGAMPNGLINAVADPAYDPLNPRPNVSFFEESGTPHVPINTEVRPGVVVSSMSLINDGIKDFIRVRFSPTTRIAGSKTGGKSIAKDFYITGKKNATSTQFTECNINQRDNALREICMKVGGAFDEETRLCEMTDLIRDPEDLVPHWLYTDGTLNPYPNTSIRRGEVRCRCDSQRCDRGADYCRCVLPSCNTIPACSGDRCIQTAMTPENYDRCTDHFLGICVDNECVFRAQCGERPQPYGYFFKPEALRTPLRDRVEEPFTRPPTREELIEDAPR